MPGVLWPNGTKERPYVSSAYGPRKAPTPGASTFHRGTDFSHTFSTIRAVADGIVSVVGTPSGWRNGGTQVWVQHDGFFSRSLHMSSTIARVGQRVAAGDPLGVMGRTGTATDTHLHFEITPGKIHFSNTGQVDPVPFITDRITATASGGGRPFPTPVPEEDDMTLFRWNELHVFGLGVESIYHVTGSEQFAELKRQHGSIVEVGNDGFTYALLERGIQWDQVDAVLRGAAYGSNGRYWSRLMAEGIAIRGEQAAQKKTLADVLATAKTVPSVQAAAG